MVQTVNIPFSELNAFPGISGVDNVTFDVPELSDIEDAIEDATLGLGSISDVVREEIDDALEDFGDVSVSVTEDFEQAIQQAVNTAIESALDVSGELDVDLGGVVEDAVQEALQVDEGLFGPLDQPIDEAFQQAVTNALSDLDELDIGLPSVEGTLEDIQQTLDSIEEGVGSVEIPDIQSEVVSALEDLPGAQLLSDPEQFIDDQIDRVTDGLVDDDARQELEDRLS